MTTDTAQVRRVKATELSPFYAAGHVLGDGATVLHISVQLAKVYVKVLTPDGHFRTRRYAHSAMVEVRA